MTLLAGFVFIISGLLILYHHVVYPCLLHYFATRYQQAESVYSATLHRFIFVIPVYNEAEYIEGKIANLANIDYPSTHVSALLLNDGSTDRTLELAQKAAINYPHLKLKILSFPANRGKVAVFNDVIPTIEDDYILFFSDASATLTMHVLQRANAWFNNPRVGVFCTKYRIKKQSLTGEKFYWDYQCQILSDESHLGAPMAYHGSGYAMRKSLWRKLPSNTINDDFIMPMRAIAQGFLGVYDEESPSTEQEISSHSLVWKRRIRIACGNIQQVGFLFSLLSPRYGRIAWMFFSGKVLRITMPWFLILLFVTNGVLAMTYPLVFLPVLAGQVLFYGAGLLNFFVKNKGSEIIAYFIKGHAAVLVGWLYFWTKVCKTHDML